MLSPQIAGNRRLIALLPRFCVTARTKRLQVAGVLVLGVGIAVMALERHVRPPTAGTPVAEGGEEALSGSLGFAYRLGWTNPESPQQLRDR